MAIGRGDDLGVRNFRDGQLIVKDGSPVPNQLEILGAEGDLSFTETDNTFPILSRGIIAARSQGDQTQMTLTFSAKFEQWSYETGESTGVSPADAFKQRGGAASWVSTAPCGPYSVDVLYKAADVCGTGGKEVLIFPKAHADSIQFSEGSEYNTLSFTATCLAASPIRSWES